MRIVVDSNVVFSGVLGSDSVPSRVLDAAFSWPDGLLFSEDLLAEYARVLNKPWAVERHGRSTTEIVAYVARIRALGVLAAPLGGPPCPDPKDQHIWDLVAWDEEAILVTGERKLLDSPHFPGRILSPRQFVERFLDTSASD